MHGFLNAKAPHAGDDKSLLDKNGTAIMVHEGADDYQSHPTGHAGKRLACGVLEMNVQP